MGPPAPPRANATSEAPEGRAWYEMKFKAGREPGLQLDINGRFNLNTYAVWLDGTTAQITVDDETKRSLPGQVRALLEQYRVRGFIEAKIDGMVEPLNFKASQAKLTVNTSDVNAALGEYQFPLDKLQLAANISDGVANLESFHLDAVGGELEAFAAYPLTGEGEAFLNWTAQNFDLQRFLASKSESEPPRIAGIFTTAGQATAKAADPKGTLGGAGVFKLTKGRLVALPLVSKIADTLAVVDQLKGATTLNHRAQGEFTIYPDRLEFAETTLVTTAFAAEIRGPMYFDQTLDLKANAGPFRRAQQLFGETLSNIFEKLTPDLVTYLVKGTIAEPKISVAPLEG